jgi:hypothetical protein
LAQWNRALAEFGIFLGNLVDFLIVWSGLGSICIYFSETEDAAISFLNTQGLRRNLKQGQGALCKFVRI